MLSAKSTAYLAADMWLASYDYNNYYSCYTLPEYYGRGKGKVVTSRPCNVGFGIYPLITLTVQQVEYKIGY